MNKPESDLDRVEKLQNKFMKTMNEITSLSLQDNPDANIQEIQNKHIIGHIATLTIISIDLGKRIKALEEKNA